MRTIDYDGLAIAYDDRVLEPRPWTALQSRWAAELIGDVVGADAPPLLELCSGAGHIGLLAASLTGRPLVCVDLDPAACDFTRRNAEQAGLADRVEVRHAALEDAVDDGETFALVLADPPWLPTNDLARYPDDPRLAVDGGDDGMAVAEACLGASLGHLPPEGSLLVQLGTHEQADHLAVVAARSGWSEDGRRSADPVAGVTDGGVVVRFRHP